MKVLLLGSGGREHALALALSQSPRLTHLFIAPGNPGTASLGTPIPLSLGDFPSILSFCRAEAIHLVVIGPEMPLVAGLVDQLEAQGTPAFGPSRQAALLEGSKAFTKKLCQDYAIPTAAFACFTDRDQALDYVRKKNMPLVVKMDGLAAGKGVIVAQHLEDAEEALQEFFNHPSASVVIEEYLEGEEISFFALCDGETAVPFGSAQDHKRVYDGDQGPNTGGMGAYSPVPLMNEFLTQRIMSLIIDPTLQAMKEKGTPFRGMLFAGLMIKDNFPKLIEFNVRFGDPETQVLLPRLQSDLLDLLFACATGTLSTLPLPLFSPLSALTVVIAAQGYPHAPRQGTLIRGVEKIMASKAPVQVYHAGTRQEGGQLFAHGGRVLNITGLGPTLAKAQEEAYKAIQSLDWPEGFYRQDIGWRALKK